MKKSKVTVKLVDKPSGKIVAFEKSEWLLADMEHYGKPVDFAKKKYKFVAKNDAGEITGTLDLMIEANLAFIEGLLVGSKHRKIGYAVTSIYEKHIFNQRSLIFTKFL